MSGMTWLNNFPRTTRGSYRIKSDEEGSEANKLDFAKKLIEQIAIEEGITVLLDAKMQGNRWVLLWWPASEPRHLETDQIITGVRDGT